MGTHIWGACATACAFSKGRHPALHNVVSLSVAPPPSNTVEKAAAEGHQDMQAAPTTETQWGWHTRRQLQQLPSPADQPKHTNLQSADDHLDNLKIVDINAPVSMRLDSNNKFIAAPLQPSLRPRPEQQVGAHMTWHVGQQVASCLLLAPLGRQR